MTGPNDASLPRTAVPAGITDPVEAARAELKAALLAIEEKANIPKRVAEASERKARAVRQFARRNPTGAIVAAIGVAAAVGVVVWGVVSLVSRSRELD